MAGAFDFYVDESLLEQLLGGGDSKKGAGKGDRAGKSGGDGDGRTRVDAAVKPASHGANGDGKAKAAVNPAPVSAPASAPAPHSVELPTVEAEARLRTSLEPAVTASSRQDAGLLLERPPVSAPLDQPASPLASSPAISPASAPGSAPASAPDDPNTVAWRDADRLYSQEQYRAAAAAYTAAAHAAAPIARLSILFFNAGVSWLQVQDLEKAHENLLRAEEAQPASRSVRLALALTLLRLKRPAEAIVHFDQALALHGGADEAAGHDADGADPVLGKIQAYCQLGDFAEASRICDEFRLRHPKVLAGFEAALAIRAAQQDRPGVEQAAQELLQLDPNAKSALKVLTAIAIARQDYATAAGYFEGLLAPGRNPDFDTCVHAATTYQACGQFELAEKAARMALDLQPKSYEALLHLAESLQKLERWQDSLVHYQRAIAIRPESADVLWNLALIQEKLGQLDEAAESLFMAVQVRTDWKEASLRLASLHLACGRYPQAAAVLEHCLMLRKDWPEALFKLGAALHHLGQSASAQDAVLKALELQPEETAWVEFLEQIAVERDDALVALDCHEKLAESHVESPEMAYNLGVVLQKENEPELAAKCYVRALEQKPDFGLALLNLGHALQDLGREDEARACWSKAIRLDPSFASGYFSS